MKERADFWHWRETYSRTLREVLGLRGSPVAVAYADRPASNGNGARYRACGATPSARDGAVISLSKSSLSCLGGVGHLGLDTSMGRMKDMVRCGFLVYGERMWRTVSGARRAVKHTASLAAPPKGLGEYIIFAPLEKAEVEPGVVLLLCNPEQACRLTSLVRFQDGVLPQCQLEGSLCWNTITYPLVTGNINISLGDASARRIENWRPDELVVSIPTPKLHSVMKSMDACAAGTASPAVRLRMSPARVNSQTMEERSSLA